MTVRPDVTIKVCKNDKDKELKVAWNLGHMTLGCYSVDHDSLKRASTKVRAELACVVQSIRDRNTSELGLRLKDLATAGYELREMLFSAMSEQPQAEAVEAWLQNNRNPMPRVSLNIDNRVHIPWGLLYDAEPAKLSTDSTNIDQYEDFWCLKYSVSAVHDLVRPSLTHNADNPLIGLSVLNKDAFETAYANLIPLEAEHVKYILSHHLKPIHSIEDFTNAWRQNRPRIGLLFFYCHANGVELALSPTESLDLNRFKLITKRKGDKRIRDQKCLVILNGCATAVGGNDGGFLEVISGEDFCGFIGVEAKIPNVFALRFGSAFLHQLINGRMMAGAVMDLLRRQHWPLSLLYSLYCDHTFHVPIKESSLPNEIDWEGNFSERNVGVEELFDSRRRAS